MKAWARWRGALGVLLVGACGMACSPGDAQRPDRLTVVHEASVDIPGGPTVLGVDALNAPGTADGLERSLTSALETQGVKREEVRSITLRQLRLEVTAPLRNGAPAQDLRFLDSLRMTMRAMDLPEVVVAQSPGPNAGATQSPIFGRDVFAVDIPPVPSVELRDHVTADTADATVAVTANGRPAFSCTVKLTITLDAQVDVAGAAQSRVPGW